MGFFTIHAIIHNGFFVTAPCALVELYYMQKKQTAERFLSLGLSKLISVAPFVQHYCKMY